MALAMDRAKVKELVAERISLFVLGKNVLERDRKLTQTRRLGPGLFVFLINQLREEPRTPPRAFVETSQ